MRLTTQKKKITIPIYHGTFEIILSNDINLVNKTIDKKLKHIYAHAYRIDKNHRTKYIALLNTFDYNLTTGTIAHEAYHLAMFLARDRGFIPSFKNDEPVAYLVDWFTMEIITFINKVTTQSQQGGVHE